MSAKTKSKAATKSEFSNETYMTWYESMLLMRRFEEKAGQLYGKQKIRNKHLHFQDNAQIIQEDYF